MRLKCIDCGVVKELNKEDIDKIKSVSEDEISKSTDYLEICNVLRGKCNGQKKHIFVFEESFSNSVQGMINIYNDTSSKRINDEKELSKMSEEIIDLENRLKSAKEKKEGLIDYIKKSETDIENILQEFEKITGDRNIDMWN